MEFLGERYQVEKGLSLGAGSFGKVELGYDKLNG
jgi:hypothetical protein